MTITIDNIKMFDSLIGNHLGYSNYKLIEQESINLFADVTGEHQWIHVDTERAAKSPFGKTIVHGYLILSLIPSLLQEIIKFENFSMIINMGCNRVRFISPVPVGSLIRVGASILEVEQVEGGIQITIDATVEVKETQKPACVAQLVIRLYK